MIEKPISLECTLYSFNKKLDKLATNWLGKCHKLLSQSYYYYVSCILMCYFYTKVNPEQNMPWKKIQFFTLCSIRLIDLLGWIRPHTHSCWVLISTSYVHLVNKDWASLEINYFERKDKERYFKRKLNIV